MDGLIDLLFIIFWIWVLEVILCALDLRKTNSINNTIQKIILKFSKVINFFKGDMSDINPLINFKSKSLNKNEGIMLISFGVTALSIFFDWVTLNHYWSKTGFDLNGYLFLILMIYPIKSILQKIEYDKRLSFGLALLNSFIIVVFMINQQRYQYSKYGNSFENVSGFGLWLAVASTTVFLIASFNESNTSSTNDKKIYQPTYDFNKNSQTDKFNKNTATNTKTEFNTNDYMKLEPFSIFKYITRAYFFVAASDGKIDSTEEDNLKNYLGALAKDLSDGDQNKFLNYCNYFEEIINSSKSNISKDFDFELEMINKYCDQYSDSKYIFAPLTYKVLISGIVSDKKIHSKELQCMRKIDLAFDVYNCKDLSDFKHKEVFKLDVSEIIKYYKDAIAQINLNFGKKRVIEYLNTQYSRWKAMEQSSESNQRAKSLDIQKQILQFRKLYK